MLNCFIKIKKMIMFKKHVYILLAISIFLSGCQNTLEGFSLKKKSNSGNEFLVKKKDPLILPPNYNKLPTPDNQVLNDEETSFEKKIFENKKEISKQESEKSGIEENILKKISN